MVLWPRPDCKRVTACWRDLPEDEVLSSDPEGGQCLDRHRPLRGRLGNAFQDGGCRFAHGV